MEYNYQQVISSMTGQVNPDVILRLPDNAWIPNDPANTDWQAYQEWLAQGGVPLPPA
jgi:DNA anti-recombination protein RmuC